MSGGLSMRPVKKPDEEDVQSPDMKLMLQGLMNKANPFAAETAVASEGAPMEVMPVAKPLKVGPSAEPLPVSTPKPQQPQLDDATLDKIMNSPSNESSAVMLTSSGDFPVIRAENDMGELKEVNLANLREFKNNESDIYTMFKFLQMMRAASANNGKIPNKYNIPMSDDVRRVVGRF